MSSVWGDIMRRLIPVLIVAAACAALGGCWFFDAAHNRRHYEVIKADIKQIHEDLDWLLLLDEPPPEDAYYR